MNKLEALFWVSALVLMASTNLQAQPSSFARWGAAQACQSDEGLEEFLARAHKLFYEGEFQKARAYYDLVLMLAPNCAEAQIGLSFTSRYLRNDSLSFVEIQKALALDSLAGPAQWIYGELMWPWRAAKWDTPLDNEDRIRLSLRHLQQAAASGHATAAHAHISLWTAYMALCDRDRMREQLMHMKAKNYFPQTVLDFSSNLLSGLEKDAILVTYGDMDTYPIFCVQEVFGVRRDVRVANFSLLGIPQILACLKKSFKIPLSEEYDFDNAAALNPYEVLKDLVTTARRRNHPVYFSITTSNEIHEQFAEELILEGLVFKVDELRAPQRLDMEKIQANLAGNYKITIPDSLRPWTSNLSPTTRDIETGIFYNYALLFRLMAAHHLENSKIELAAPYWEKLFALYHLVSDESAQAELLREWLAHEPNNPQPKNLARLLSQK